MMRKQQRGMTTIGMILVVAVLGSIAFGIIQMVPVYLENMKIVQVLNQTKTGLDGQNAGVTEIRKALEKRLDIESLSGIDIKKEFLIKRTEAGMTLTAKYERRKSYFYNLYLLAEFEHSVEITR